MRPKKWIYPAASIITIERMTRVWASDRVIHDGQVEAGRSFLCKFFQMDYCFYEYLARKLYRAVT